MRDPERIPRILAKIERIWAKAPDLRLMQLLASVDIIEYYTEDISYDVSTPKGRSPRHTIDPFYDEDTELEKKLDKELEK